MENPTVFYRSFSLLVVNMSPVFRFMRMKPHFNKELNKELYTVNAMTSKSERTKDFGWILSQLIRLFVCSGFIFLLQFHDFFYLVHCLHLVLRSSWSDELPLPCTDKLRCLIVYRPRYNYGRAFGTALEMFRRYQPILELCPGKEQSQQNVFFSRAMTDIANEAKYCR